MDAPSPSTEEPELLTPEEIAGALKVSVGTIYYWTSRREIPFLKVGRHLRFNLGEVIAFFRAETRPDCNPQLSALRRAVPRSLTTKATGHSPFPKQEEEYGDK